MNRVIIWITAWVLISLPAVRAESNAVLAEIDEERYYMWTRDDIRACPAPECGGFYVRALNRARTLCADGGKAEDCHVLQLDFSLLGMSETEQAAFEQAFADGLGIIRGRLFQALQNDIFFSGLKVHEAWLAQAGKSPPGRVFFQVHDTGVQCITSPCLTVEERLLNLPGERVIAGVDLSPSGAGTGQLSAGYQEMKTGFVIATGRHETVQGPAGFSRILVAGEFYLPAEKAETCGNTVCPAGQTCCNASCGICVPPGGACIQIACD